MAQTDRTTGAVSSVAVKAPVKCASAANVATLSGEQTVNGTALVADDRVLLKNQTDQTENGIWVVDTGDWSRAQDFNASDDIITGTMTFSVAQLAFYYVSSANNPTIDTDNITFSQAPVDVSGASAYFQTLFTAASASALRTLLEINRMVYVQGAGTVDAITANFSPDLGAWDGSYLMLVESTGANTSTTPTLTPDALTGKTIVKGSDQALEAGDVPGANFLMMLRYDASLDKVQLLNPALGITRTATVPVVGAVQNLGAAVSLAANALTFALKDKDGNNPTVGSPIEAYFQSATVTTGTYAKRSITAAASIVIPATALVGTISGAPSRIYFGLLDNAGTLELCYWNPCTMTLSAGAPGWYDVTGLMRVSPNDVVTSVANTTGSDSAGVVYSDSARSNVRVMPIAYVDSEQATAGNWATAITKLVLIDEKTPITGDILRAAATVTGAVATGTSVIPMDDTIPAAGEGDAYMTVSISVPIKQTIVEIEAIGNVASSVATDGLAAYIYSSAGNVHTMQSANGVAAGDQVAIPLAMRQIGDFSGTFGFQFVAGGSAAGTTTFNGRAAGRLYGGAMGSHISARAICL